MTQKELYLNCSCGSANDLVEQLQSALDQLMTYFGMSPFEDSAEAQEISRSYRVLTNTIRYFNQLEDAKVKA